MRRLRGKSQPLVPSPLSLSSRSASSSSSSPKELAVAAEASSSSFSSLERQEVAAKTVEFFPQKHSPPSEEARCVEKEVSEEKQHEEFKRQLRRFLIEHTPVYGPVWLRYGFLAAFLLWAVLSFGVFGYAYKALVFGALVYENEKAPSDDLIVVEKLMDAGMERYLEIPPDKNEPIVRHSVPFLELVNARYTIARSSDQASLEYESSFWQCFSMVHAIGAAMLQVVLCGAAVAGWVFYYVFGYRLFAYFKGVAWVARIRENPTLFFFWYVCVGLIGCGYLYKIAVYVLAVVNTSINSNPDAFTVADLGLDPQNYNVLLSFASASFNIVSDGQGVKYYSNSFWTFWDGAHFVGALGTQAVICIAIPLYRYTLLLFWTFVKFLFAPVLRHYGRVNKRIAAKAKPE